MDALEITEHQLGAEDVASMYGCVLSPENPMRSQGLSGLHVEANRKRFGENELPEVPRPSLIVQYFKYFFNLFSMMLVLCGFLSIILFIVYPTVWSHLYIGLVLIAVAFFNAFLEFYQKFKSEELLKGFMNMIPDKVFVLRDGRIEQISALSLVVGDLMLLRAGDKIGADGRVVSSSELRVDNSILTGESEAPGRDRAASEPGTSIVDARNLVFNGTTVSGGEGLAIAIRTGPATAIGKLSNLASSSVAAPSQLSQEMDVAVRTLVTAGLTTGITLMVVSFAQGFGLAVSFDIAISSFLAFLPQGLPATITILLTVAAKRMAKKNVLVKNLQGVETLGTITLLATDKTGTLTMNRMEVVASWVGEFRRDGGETSVQVQEISELDGKDRLVEVCRFCTNIKVIPGETATAPPKLLGDATEQGLHRMVQSKVQVTEGEDVSQRIFEIPFSSATKWHLVIQEHSRTQKRIIYMKGAPEKVFTHCKKFVRPDVEITSDMQEAFDQAYEELGKRGLRVLACAWRELEVSETIEALKFDDLIFAGIVGLQDPPKPGIVDSIRKLGTAGIQVIMITGDHPVTAEAISRQIGLLGPESQVLRILPDETWNIPTDPSGKALLIHGEAIDQFTTKDWDRLVLFREIVFARTQPKHKLAIVESFQAYGHVVAVSGDGANDSPALKKADLGISMNHTASDVSKEAADLILLDDNFNTIIAGIAEGRLIFENLKKSIRYTITHIFPEVSSLATVAICGIPFPFPALLILMFDVFCEPGPAMSFATEGPPLDFLKLKPRKRPRLRREDSYSADSVRANDLDPSMKAKIAFNECFSLIVLGFIVDGVLRHIVSLYHLKIEGERLMDGEMVFWAFLQGGIFLAVGCFAAYLVSMIWDLVPLNSLWRGVTKYFESDIGIEVQPLTLTDGQVIGSDQQTDILQRAQSAFFLSLVLGQWFNLFLTKHRYRYPHGWDIFRNPSTYMGMFASGAISCLIVFVPVLQTVFQTQTIVAVTIACPVVSGCLLVLYEYPRRYVYFNKIRHIDVNALSRTKTLDS